MTTVIFIDASNGRPILFNCIDFIQQIDEVIDAFITDFDSSNQSRFALFSKGSVGRELLKSLSQRCQLVKLEGLIDHGNIACIMSQLAEIFRASSNDLPLLEFCKKVTKMSKVVYDQINHSEFFDGLSQQLQSRHVYFKPRS